MSGKTFRPGQRAVATPPVGDRLQDIPSVNRRDRVGPRSWTLGLIGICIFTFATLTERLPVGDLGGAIALVGAFLQRDRMRAPAVVWWLLAFVGWASIGLLTSLFPGDTQLVVIERLKMAVIMLLAVNTIRTDRQMRLFLAFVVAAFVLFPLRSTLVNYAIGSRLFGRAVGSLMYANPNDLAGVAMLVLAIALTLATASGVKKFWRIAAYCSTGLLVLVIVLTQSRGALIGVAVGFAPAVASLVFRRARRMVYAAIAVAALVAMTPASVWERYAGLEKLTSESTMAQADAEGSAAERIEIQKIAWRVAIDHPIFGVGLGTYGRVNAIYSPELGRKDTHDTYLNLAAETGFPGVLLWFATVYSVFAKAISRKRLESGETDTLPVAWLRRGLVGFLVAAVFGSYSGLNIFYLYISILWVTADLSKQQSNVLPAAKSARAV